MTLCFHFPPFSSFESQSRIFNIFAAHCSESFKVSSLLTAAKARTPFPMEETIFPSTETEAEWTRCNITGAGQRTRDWQTQAMCCLPFMVLAVWTGLLCALPRVLYAQFQDANLMPGSRSQPTINEVIPSVE